MIVLIVIPLFTRLVLLITSSTCYFNIFLFCDLMNYLLRSAEHSSNRVMEGKVYFFVCVSGDAILHKNSPFKGKISLLNFEMFSVSLLETVPKASENSYKLFNFLLTCP